MFHVDPNVKESESESVAEEANGSSAGLSGSMTFKCSARMPVNPAAPPRFASRNAAATAVEPSRRRLFGRHSATSDALPYAVAAGGGRGLSTNAKWPRCRAQAQQPTRDGGPWRARPWRTFVRAFARPRPRRHRHRADCGVGWIAALRPASAPTLPVGRPLLGTEACVVQGHTTSTRASHAALGTPACAAVAAASRSPAGQAGTPSHPSSAFPLDGDGAWRAEERRWARRRRWRVVGGIGRDSPLHAVPWFVLVCAACVICSPRQQPSNGGPNPLSHGHWQPNNIPTICATNLPKMHQRVCVDPATTPAVAALRFRCDRHCWF